MKNKLDDRFFVLNRKHLNCLSGDLPSLFIDVWNLIADKLKEKGKLNKYIVVNIDEPYADKVIELILKQEQK